MWTKIMNQQTKDDVDHQVRREHVTRTRAGSSPGQARAADAADAAASGRGARCEGRGQPADRDAPGGTASTAAR